MSVTVRPRTGVVLQALRLGASSDWPNWFKRAIVRGEVFFERQLGKPPLLTLSRTGKSFPISRSTHWIVEENGILNIYTNEEMRGRFEFADGTPIPEEGEPNV